MTARWHLGPISGFHLWWVLVTSPEVLVFLFFMITDPKTAPRSPTARLVYAISLGLLAGGDDRADDDRVRGEGRAARLARRRLPRAAAAAPRPEAARPAARRRHRGGRGRRVGGGDRRRQRARGRRRLARGAAGALPPITILPAQGVQTKLDLHTAQLIAHDLLAAKPSAGAGPLRIWLVQGVEQGPPTATVQQRRPHLPPAPDRGRAVGASFGGAVTSPVRRPRR